MATSVLSLCARARHTGDMDAEEVLRFWFGDVGDDGLAESARVERWFLKSDAFDAEIRQRFLPYWSAIMADGCVAWLRDARSLLAYVIVLDQFARNMFRDQAQAFAGDERALKAASGAIAGGIDQRLPGQLRVFLYMPLMHSEQLADQEQCVALFTRFRDRASAPLREMLSQNLAFAQRHRDIIARFGRFPHRNQTLGRESTPEELAFLQEPGSSF